MIIFDLACANGHRFEGWFKNGDDFTAQLQSGFLDCPVCSNSTVRRVPSAIAIASAKSSAHGETTAPSAQSSTPQSVDGQNLGRLFLRAMHALSEDVGAEFTNEARRIHYHEAPERSIRGQATPDQMAELKDEGIEVFMLPKDVEH